MVWHLEMMRTTIQITIDHHPTIIGSIILKSCRMICIHGMKWCFFEIALVLFVLFICQRGMSLLALLILYCPFYINIPLYAIHDTDNCVIYFVIIWFWPLLIHLMHTRQLEYVETTIEMPRQVMESHPEPHQEVNHMKVAWLGWWTIKF